MNPINAKDRILVTGATGFLGRHVVPALKNAFEGRGVPVYEHCGRDEYDLTDPSAATDLFHEASPTVVVHLAAKVGGIGANKCYPVDFHRENALINLHVFERCRRAGVRKLLAFIGGCSYPANAQSPISEDQFWRGYPQEESAPYSTAKLMSLVLSKAYRQQFNMNSIVLVPGNLYGEHDNFSLQSGHVVPATIRKFVEAREAGVDTVEMWGDGSPVRDFVYAEDVAELVPWFLEQYDLSKPVNLSRGNETTIKELAELIQRMTGFHGGIEWNTAHPNGQAVKTFDVSRLTTLGFACKTPLRDGLWHTLQWFEGARKDGSARL